jgi:hypothetical protein
MKKATDDPMTKLADAAFRQAARKVIQRAKEAGTTVVVWEDGEIKEVDPRKIKNGRRKRQCVIQASSVQKSLVILTRRHWSRGHDVSVSRGLSDHRQNSMNGDVTSIFDPQSPAQSVVCDRFHRVQRRFRRNARCGPYQAHKTVSEFMHSIIGNAGAPLYSANGNLTPLVRALVPPRSMSQRWPNQRMQ